MGYSSMTVRAVLTALAVSLSATSHAVADPPKQQVDIAAGSLANALLELSNRYGADLVYRPDQVQGLKTNGAHGQLTTAQAVTRLLQGTALQLSTGPQGGMLIAAPQAGTTSLQGSPGSDPAAKEGKTGSSNGFRLAQTDQGGPAGGVAMSNADASFSRGEPIQLEEIVVTAQKRSERLMDVPIPVTVINTASLVGSNQLRIQDYYTSVPGLSVAPSTNGQTLSIRGITTGASTNPTVGVTVDDVPFGSSTLIGGGALVPDFDPGDLAQIEVLRGPQGTLYGASAMGGLLKFVTRDPSTDGFSGRVEAGLSEVQNGPLTGYDVRASVNVPLGDSLAMLASGFTRREPGYIDDVETGHRGANEERVDGGRLSFMWRPTDFTSWKVSALLQDDHREGSSDVDAQTGLGDLQQNYLLGAGGFDKRVQAYSSIFKADLGGVNITSVTGYNINRVTDSTDLSYIYGPVAHSLAGVSGAAVPAQDTTYKFSQELRFAGSIGARLDWLLAGFFTHEDSPTGEQIVAVNPATGADVKELLNIDFPSTYREYAGFANLTYHFTDQFDLQLGGRESRIRETSLENETGVAAGNGLFLPEVESTGSAFTYQVTPEYKLSSDMMVYARIASGYRAGGTNVSPGVPRGYDPDKTLNYELGLKSQFFERKLSLEASVYYIDWKDIQLSLTAPNQFGYIANAGRAKSQGVELSMETRPLTGLVINAWIAWDDAVLTEGFPTSSSAHGASGDRLPFSSRYSGNLSVEQQFPVTRELTGFVGATSSYTGDRLGLFTATTARQDLPGYSRTDLRAGTYLGPWTFNLYGTNVTNRRGLLLGGLGSAPAFAFQYIQPRTLGLNVARTF